MENSKIITVSLPQVSELINRVSNWEEIDASIRENILECDDFSMRNHEIIVYSNSKISFYGSYMQDDVECNTVTIHSLYDRNSVLKF